jgi:uridine kinase
MNHFFVGIAGGSGSGKSTLSYRLRDNFPDFIEVVHFDDYIKEDKDVPFLEGMRNWDHPDAIYFEKLYQDLLLLKEDQKIKIMTKSSIINPIYEEKGRIQHTLEPKKIIIVEGYMALLNKKINDLFDLKIFLNIPINESITRRNKTTYDNESEYNKKILIPMHKKYVEPTKNNADLLIDALNNNKDEVYKIVFDKLTKIKLLPSNS